MIKKVKTFDELTNQELYEILKLRMQVFIVEQKGCYQDLDDFDQHSVHIFYEDNQGQVQGAIRVFLKKDEMDCVQFGRLVCKCRYTGLGRQLINDAQIVAQQYFHANHIYLTGRKSAFGFYLKCDFKLIEEVYTKDTSYGIFRKTIKK